MTTLLGLLALAYAAWGVGGQDTTITVGIPSNPRYQAQAAHMPHAYQLGQPCEITIRPEWVEWPQDYTLYVLTHEAGHCLGLDHSEDTGSIMYRNTDYRGTITLADWEALRNARPPMRYRAIAIGVAQ